MQHVADNHPTDVEIDEMAELTRNSALFDSRPYEVASADKITIAFSGSISFEGGDEQGETLYRSLQLGSSVVMRVEGVVASVAGRYARARDDEETITGIASVRVESLYLPAPEQL